MPDALPYRVLTDESLRSERGKTDRELEKKRTEIEADSDAVLAEAQDRASSVLQAARDRADMQDRGTRAGLQVAREVEDRVLEEERQTAAAALAKERQLRQRALLDLLRYEREETDKDLRMERTGADAALGTRDAFLGVVTHDLRTLLGGVALNAELLLMEAPQDERSAKVIKRAESIQRCTARMSRVLGDLLDVVAIEAGKLRVTPKENDVGGLLDEAVDTVALAAANKGLAIVIGTPLEPMRARFDYDRLLQVITNLLSNGVKFTPPGGRVELRAVQEGDRIHLTVSDNGSGIPKEQLETVFERFHQVDHGDRRGHGLGLFISRSIMDSHGGSLWVESPGENQGCIFHITFPA